MKLPIRPITLRALAKLIGRPVRSVHRQTIDLHMRCCDGTCGSLRANHPSHRLWLIRPPRGAWCVNVSLYRREHPERFEAPSVEEVSERVDDLEQYERDTRKRVNALATAFNEHMRSAAHAGPKA